MNHNNQYETTKGDKTVNKTEFRIEQHAKIDDPIRQIPSTNNSSLSHEGRSSNVSPIYPKSEDKKEKHRFIKLARIALFKTKRSPIKVQRVEIIESSPIELNMMGSCNSTKKNLNGSTDGDSDYHKCNNSGEAGISSNFELTNEQSNISPLMDSKVTTCTDDNGTIDMDKFENGEVFKMIIQRTI